MRAVCIARLLYVAGPHCRISRYNQLDLVQVYSFLYLISERVCRLLAFHQISLSIQASENPRFIFSSTSYRRLNAALLVYY